MTTNNMVTGLIGEGFCLITIWLTPSGREDFKEVMMYIGALIALITVVNLFQNFAKTRLENSKNRLEKEVLKLQKKQLDKYEKEQ